MGAPAARRNVRSSQFGSLADHLGNMLGLSAEGADLLAPRDGDGGSLGLGLGSWLG